MAAATEADDYSFAVTTGSGRIDTSHTRAAVRRGSPVIGLPVLAAPEQGVLRAVRW
jgi:ferric-dicitrate binding protein FerR (iron transport regulator)